MNYQQPAFILHSRPYRETSVMLTLFTPQFGKLQATVRGVRGSKRAALKQAWLQPFQVIQFQWRSQNFTDWIYPQSFEPYGVPIRLNGEANICGLYLNELLYRLLHNSESAPDLFIHYQQTLQGLAESNSRNDQAWLLRQFELILLQDLGYRLDLQADGYNHPIQADQRYQYHHEIGFILSSDPQLGYSGACLLHLASGQFKRECLSVWKHLMRQALQPYLGAKPLATRMLFESP